MMTGGRTVSFREGWACRILSWGPAHYFRRAEAGICNSICGSMQGVPAGALLEAGNWKKCKRCERLIGSENKR